MTEQLDMLGAGRTFKGGGYAATPGTGPAGETCGSCRHCQRGGYTKCALTRHTSCEASDIRLIAPACLRWEPLV